MPYGFERLLGWPIGMQCTRTLACVQEGDARLLAAVQLRSRPFEPLILYTSEMHQKPARAIKHDRRARCWQLAIEALDRMALSNDEGVLKAIGGADAIGYLIRRGALCHAP